MPLSLYAEDSGAEACGAPIIRLYLDRTKQHRICDLALADWEHLDRKQYFMHSVVDIQYMGPMLLVAIAHFIGFLNGEIGHSRPIKLPLLVSDLHGCDTLDLSRISFSPYPPHWSHNAATV